MSMFRNRVRKKKSGAGIPVTYVPARTPIFSRAPLAWAETIPAGHIFIGANAIDYSGYPDCRPEFIALFETLATSEPNGRRRRAHSNSRAADQLSKSESFAKGVELKVDLSLTHSCYDPTSTVAPAAMRFLQVTLERFSRSTAFTDPIKYARSPSRRSS